MLIPSERHRPEDLELWAELEEADRSHGERLLRSGKVTQSLEALRAFAACGSCHVSVSGGKDSAATVALCDAAGLLDSVPAFHFRAMPKGNPDTPAALARLAERFSAMRLTVVEYDSPVPVGPRDNAERVASTNFFAACASVGGRRILGVRADESGVRKISLRSRGLLTENSCRPLGWWSLADVYGYAAVTGIPLHPVYGMLGGGRWPRKALRVDALMGANGEQFGRAEWEREYYSDILNRLGSRRG